MDFLKDIVSKDIELGKLLAKALREPHGGDRKSETAKIKNTIGVLDFKKEESMVSQLSLPEGEKKPKKERKKQEQYGQRILRLEKRSPELYAQVVAGEKTIHAAAVEAKIDHPTMTVTLDSPKSAASLIARASPVFIEKATRTAQTLLQGKSEREGDAVLAEHR